MAKSSDRDEPPPCPKCGHPMRRLLLPDVPNRYVHKCEQWGTISVCQRHSSQSRPKGRHGALRFDGGQAPVGLSVGLLSVQPQLGRKVETLKHQLIRLVSSRARVHISEMSGWKFIAEFRRGRKEPIALECFVSIPDLEQAQKIAKLVGADAIKAEQISKAELVHRDVKNGEAVIQ